MDSLEKVGPKFQRNLPSVTPCVPIIFSRPRHGPDRCCPEAGSSAFRRGNNGRPFKHRCEIGDNFVTTSTAGIPIVETDDRSRSLAPFEVTHYCCRQS